MTGGKPVPSWWRFSVLRPGGGWSLWYQWGGHGRRLLIWSSGEKRVDVDHLREITRETRAYGWRR